MLARKLVTIAFVVLFITAAWSSSSLAGTRLYEGKWIAESFGNDKVGIGDADGFSLYFSVLAVPQGAKCHATNPKCNIASTPTDGTDWNPLGPNCRPLTGGELPRPAKGGTATTGLGGKIPPLHRNAAFFTAPGGAPYTTSCTGRTTASYSYATTYLPPWSSGRGIAQLGAPLSGNQKAVTTAPGQGKAFTFPAAPAGTGFINGMRRLTTGSFIGSGNYLYSYTYADLRNDAGDFGAGQGFFTAGAAAAAWTHYAKTADTPAASKVAKAKVNRGTNRFGGVMKLLGTYNNKVCYYYSGCGLGYNTWYYQSIGAAPLNTAAGVPDDIFTNSWYFSYFNTGLGSAQDYTGIASRFPWTTGSVTITATLRGDQDTFVQREGFDNRDSAGVGTVQLVSPILTQWLSADPAGPVTDTGGVAIMEIKFAPEPGGIASLIAGLSMLVVLHRSRR